MEGSELEEVFQTVYGKNTVTHMFSGKPISRILYWYFFVETALQMTLIRYLLPEKTDGIDEKVTEKLQSKIFKCENFNN